MDEPMHPLAQIASIANSVRRFLETGLASRDLTFNQYNVLQLLSDHGTLRPSELADAVSVNRPTMTVILRNVEKKGWIDRRIDPENRRSIRVSLTPEGAEKASTSREWIIRVKGSFDPLVGLTTSELETLCSLLGRIQISADDHLESLASRLSEELAEN